MPRLKSGELPTYRLHKSSNQAIVSFPLRKGEYKDFLLGPYGSKESRAEYDRLISEFLANGRRWICSKPINKDVTVVELLLRFFKHAEVYYRDPEGKQTSEVKNFTRVILDLRSQWAEKLVADFRASGKKEKL